MAFQIVDFSKNWPVPRYKFGRIWVPRQQKLKSRYNCVLPCHSYNDISCVTRNAHSFYKWLMYHFQTKSYVKCPKNLTRLTAMFVSTIWKRRQPVTYHLVYLAMSARKRLHPSPVGEPESKRKAPDFDTCNFFVEAVNPAFDLNRFLLRRVFFINEEKTRYVSVGFSPTRNYQPLVEFRGSKIKPIILTDPEQVATMAECLRRICEAMCDNGLFAWSHGAFRLNTTGSYRITRLYIEKHYISPKCQEMRYLLNMIYIVQNHFNSYITALPDIVTYLISALSSDTYVEPPATASKWILYPQRFKELKTTM